jgi:hypothetical protein
MTLEQAKKLLRESEIYFYEGEGVWVGADDADENDANNMKPTLGIDGQLTAESIMALAIVVAAEGLNFSLKKELACI